MWRILRISFLLAILAFVALGALVDRWHTTEWDRTLWVGVFPVNADGLDSTAAYDRTNNVVLAHELLHTLGATDKYDPATSQPLFPQGHAEPDATPRHPQRLAEIMAGRIAVSDDEAEMPASLAQAVVGTETAQEINWIRRP